MTRLVLSTLAVAALTACTPMDPAAGGPAPSGPTRVTAAGLGIAGGTGTEIQLGEDGPITQTVPAPPEQVWAALPSVYESLGITGAAAEPSARVFGTRKLVVRRRLGDHPLSRYLACGRTATGQITANLYRIHLSVVTSVQPAAPGGSQVQTQVIASAQSTEGTSTDPVRCASRGVLEEEIARLAGTQSAPS